MNISVTFTSCQEVEEFVSMFGGCTSCAKPDAAVAEKNAGLAESPRTVTPVEPTVQSKPVASAAPVIPTAPAVSVTAAVPVAQAPATPVVPTAPVGVTAPVQASVPTSTHTYTPDELAGAAMQLMDSGRQNELLSLLQQFGVNSIPALQPLQYGAFATALRDMGAQI